MKMPRDLVALRCRIVAVSAVLIALCTAVCMALLAVPLINADMAARRHVLEELSNQPFDIERAAAGIDTGGASGLVVTGPDISWCRVAVDESGEVVAVEAGERRPPIASPKAARLSLRAFAMKLGAILSLLTGATGSAFGSLSVPRMAP